MSNKEMIEEMAKDIETSNVYIDSNDVVSDDGEYYFQWQDGCKELAIYLYEQGYRKLPEDSVVLSKEEYKLLFDIKKKFETADGDEITAVSLLMWLKELTAQERKETAEEFLQFVYDRCLDKSFIRAVEKFAKQFGVEIKE